MKRSRDEIEQRISVLEKKRRAVESKLGRVDEALGAERSALSDISAAWIVTVPWSAFERAASHSSSAWEKEEAGSDAYHAARQCEHDDCWYQRNLDRIDELTHLFTLRTLDGLEFTLCDVCYSKETREEIIEDYAAGRGGRRETAQIDLDGYEFDIAKFLKRAARGKLSEDAIATAKLASY